MSVGTSVFWIHVLHSLALPFLVVDFSPDLQMVNISLRILFRPQERNLPDMFRSYGTDFDERVLPSVANEVSWSCRSVIVWSTVWGPGADFFLIALPLINLDQHLGPKYSYCFAWDE